MIVPVILSGGSGTRLWPLSRRQHPKQFFDLVNKNTLFQDTILRLPEELSPPIIVCNEDHRFLAAEQLREINTKVNGIILEPTGKNTAPAIALAALKLLDLDENPILLVLSADSLIKNVEEFHRAIKVATTLAKKNKLVTFGIIPTKAETGYGYIEATIKKSDNFYNIKSFKEKPSQKNANKYIESENYLWNSGMFMFNSSTYLNELEKFEPNMLSICKESLKNERIDSDFIRIDGNIFNQCPDKSIDYAVMEKTRNGVVVPLDIQWQDVGSWPSLWDVKTKSKKDNVIQGDVLIEGVEKSYIYSSNRLVAVLGLSNLVIVDTQDALLVADKRQASNIPKIVEKLNYDKRIESVVHKKVYRPWGYYDLVEAGNGFQVKRISVNPGAKLSLQKHKYRAEHWVVVRGAALVTCDNKKFELLENQSTYIPQGSLHRLENCQNDPLEIIEIQTGTYLGEDDIIRLEDDYQRK